MISFLYTVQSAFLAESSISQHHKFLPTADVFTDIILVVKLYKPQPRCKKYYWQYDDGHLPSGIYEKCEEDPLTFCSKDENREHCKFYEPRYNIATVLLMPFLLNYIVCFYTFFRLTTNRKRYTFIFPLLNLYPQYGRNLSI